VITFIYYWFTAVLQVNLLRCFLVPPRCCLSLRSSVL